MLFLSVFHDFCTFVHFYIESVIGLNSHFIMFHHVCDVFCTTCVFSRVSFAPRAFFARFYHLLVFYLHCCHLCTLCAVIFDGFMVVCSNRAPLVTWSFLVVYHLCAWKCAILKSVLGRLSRFYRVCVVLRKCCATKYFETYSTTSLCSVNVSLRSWPRSLTSFARSAIASLSLVSV